MESEHTLRQVCDLPWKTGAISCRGRYSALVPTATRWTAQQASRRVGSDDTMWKWNTHPLHPSRGKWEHHVFSWRENAKKCI
jgi:hypothetical protein